jgi:hypothetical protein
VTDHTVSTPRLAAPRPRQTHPLPAHVEERFRPIIGEQVALVRPYLINFEQQHERDLQRERRTAAALADLGIDYDVTAVLA